MKSWAWVGLVSWPTADISGHPSAIGQALDKESSPVKDRCSTTVPLNQGRRADRRGTKGWERSEWEAVSGNGGDVGVGGAPAEICQLSGQGNGKPWQDLAAATMKARSPSRRCVSSEQANRPIDGLTQCDVLISNGYGLYRQGSFYAIFRDMAPGRTASRRYLGLDLRHEGSGRCLIGPWPRSSEVQDDVWGPIPHSGGSRRYVGPDDIWGVTPRVYECGNMRRTSDQVPNISQNGQNFWGGPLSLWPPSLCPPSFTGINCPLVLQYGTRQQRRSGRRVVSRTGRDRTAVVTSQVDFPTLTLDCQGRRRRQAGTRLVSRYRRLHSTWRQVAQSNMFIVVKSVKDN